MTGGSSAEPHSIQMLVKLNRGGGSELLVRQVARGEMLKRDLAGGNSISED